MACHFLSGQPLQFARMSPAAKSLQLKLPSRLARVHDSIAVKLLKIINELAHHPSHAVNNIHAGRNLEVFF
jgi:hypothetical protein